jgi:hypothetical protein
MTYERIRIYEGTKNPETSIIGMSMGASHILERGKDEIDTLLAEGNQTITQIDPPDHLKNIWSDYYEIQPPLSETQIEKFARICIKHTINPGGIQVSDNREVIPSSAFESVGRVIVHI